jgi:tRNA threonylcarbamoyladenosine biosynthesis protein TsaE
MIRARTDRVEATRALAAALADLLVPGDLLVLTGDLGAGKTAFVQGLAGALGVTEQVTSPTFTLAHRYEGRMRIHHLDVYRFEHLDEVLDIDLPELLEDGGVTVIEWGDAIRPALPPELLEIRLHLGAGHDDREVEVEPRGGPWLARRRALVEALAPWAADGGAGAAGGAAGC